MARFKSLRLVGAKEAFHKLFGRSTTQSSQHISEPSTSSTTSATETATEDEGDACDILPQQHSHIKHPNDQDYILTEPSSGTDQAAKMTIATFPSGQANPQERLERRSWANKNDKENQPPVKPSVPRDISADPTAALQKLSINDVSSRPGLVEQPVEVYPSVEEPPEVQAEKRKHLNFIEEALEMARLALRTNETPVGCVLVYRDQVIARGMNATNVTRNGTRHAEFMAICALLSYPPRNTPKTTSLRPRDCPVQPRPEFVNAVNEDGEVSDTATISTADSRPPDEGNEDGRKGHLYPYGQKELPDERVDISILKECTLYVTVEPCIMCASMLRQVGIKKVYFGAVNDKFGGTGGVFSIHANSLPVSKGGESKAAHPTPRPTQLPDGSGTLSCPWPSGGGDGGNVEAGYDVEGGWGRDDAVGLLRRFYVQENGRAPVPRKKEGRAARLAAMMEQEGGEDLGEDATEALKDGSTPLGEEKGYEAAGEGKVCKRGSSVVQESDMMSLT